MSIKPEITDEKALKLLGCVFYGDPFHEAREWTYENEIGKLWTRFMTLAKKYSILLESLIVEPGISYEVHLEPEEYERTKKYYVFVGIEVKNYDEIPLEMYVKIIPNTKYLVFTTKTTKFGMADNVFRDWLPKSDYEQSYPFIIQAYDMKRYKGLDSEDSEIDWYIPIKKK